MTVFIRCYAHAIELIKHMHKDGGKFGPHPGESIQIATTDECSQCGRTT